MELVNRYLQAVKRYLPASDQSDVIAELSDSIQSHVEDKEAELGRPLTLDEESTLLKTYGHPLIVASRYRPHQQLIGPALFPFYINSLKVILAVALSLVGAITLMSWAATGDAITAFGRFWGAMWTTFFTIVGIVTVIFAAVERLQHKEDYTTSWDPRSLPPVQVQLVPLGCSITELAFNVLFAVLFLSLPGARRLFETGVIGPVVSLPFSFGSWWGVLITTLICTSLVQATMNAINIARPDWYGLRAGTLAATSSALFIAACYVLRHHDLVVVANTVNHAAQYAAKASALSEVVMLAMLGLAIVSLFTIVSNVGKLMRRPPALPSMQKAGAR